MEKVRLKRHLFEHIQVTTQTHRDTAKFTGLVVELCDVMVTLDLCLVNHDAGNQGKALKNCSRKLLERIKDPALRVLLKRMLQPFSLPLGVFNELESVMEIALRGTYRELNKQASNFIPQHLE